jgi:hypothetical protein
MPDHRWIVTAEASGRELISLGTPAQAYASSDESRPRERVQAARAVKVMLSKRTETEVPRPHPREVDLSPANLARVRDLAIDQAVADRKIPEDRRGFYEMRFSASPEATLAELDRLEAAPATVAMQGFAPAPAAPMSTAQAESTEDAYPAAWLNHLPQSEREFIRAAQEDRPQQSRVVIEQ